MKSLNSSMSARQPQLNNGTNTALLAGAGASIVSGAGGTTLLTCKDDDNSIYCKLVRAFNVFKMGLAVIVVFIIIYFVYKLFAANKGKGKKK